MNTDGHGLGKRRQARHICRIIRQQMFQAPSGAAYSAPTGLGIYLDSGATKIPLLRSYFSAMTRMGTVMVPRGS